MSHETSSDFGDAARPAERLSGSNAPEASYRTRVVESLHEYSDAELDLVTAEASVFLDRRWLRLLETIDVSELVGGDVDVRYVTVELGTTLVGLCPFIVTRSPSVYYLYSFEKFFFTAWRDDPVRMNADNARWSQWLAHACAGYRRLARGLRTGCEGWVLALSPLSFRSGIAQRASSSGQADSICQASLAALQDVARQEGLPLCVCGVPEDAALRAQLQRREFFETFVVFDSRIDLTPMSFDQYFERFTRDIRGNHKYEIRLAHKQGYRFEVRTDFRALAADFERFYDATSTEYGPEHIAHPPRFWTELERCLGPNAEAVVALHDGRPVGFSMLLRKHDEMFVYRSGRLLDESGREPPIYPSLLVYEPLRRALELGVKRLWLGTGVYDVKRRRGAKACALYHYFWFPNTRSRRILAPYLRLFGQIARAQMADLVVTQTSDTPQEN